MITFAGPASQNARASSVALEAVKARQRSAWSSGDYAIVGTTLQIVGEELCEALDLRAGQRVLDVAAGTSVRFEPGIAMDVTLVPLGGRRIVAGLRGEVAGPLDGERDGDGGEVSA